jgi:hypothetical protein
MKREVENMHYLSKDEIEKSPLFLRKTYKFNMYSAMALYTSTWIFLAAGVHDLIHLSQNPFEKQDPARSVYASKMSKNILFDIGIAASLALLTSASTVLEKNLEKRILQSVKSKS